MKPVCKDANSMGFASLWASLHRCSCAAVVGPVKMVGADGSELSRWHNKFASTSRGSCVGERHSPRDIALSAPTLGLV